MAVVSTYSGAFSELILKFLETDSLKAILMDTTFAFDPDTHGTYADISAHEIATGFGYTQKTKELANVAVAYDNATNKTLITADNLTWTASGGSIPAVGAMCIIDDDDASDTVVLCIDFGADYTTASGTIFQVNFTNGVAKATLV